MSSDPNNSVSRRNFQLGVVNGTMFSLADALLDPTLVFVAFAATMTRSPILLGLIVPLRNAGWFLPQLWVSGRVQAWPRKLPLYAGVAGIRVFLWAGLVAAVFFLPSGPWLLAISYVLYIGLDFASGVGGLAFMDVVAKVIPARRRGEFFAWRLALGGVLGVLGGALVHWSLDPARPWGFPQNFGIIFGASFAAALIGLFAFVRVEEPAEAEVPSAASFRDQLRQARRLTGEDANYRKFLQMRSALMVAGAATPFFVVAFQERFGLQTEWIGVYLAAYTAATLVATVVLGRLSSVLGNRRTMGAASAAGLAMVALVMLVLGLAGFLPIDENVAGWSLVPVFVLSGIREAGIGIAAASLLLDLAPPGQRPLYVGFTHSVLGAVLLATAASGLVVQFFGHETMYLIALLANLAAMRYAQRMAEPVLEGTAPSYGLSYSEEG